MPINNSGQTETGLLSIPRGCFRAALMDNNDVAGPFRDIGNVSSGQLSFSSEFAEHFTSCGEDRVRDARVPVETTVDLSLTLDHILDLQNLELIFSATQYSRVNPSAGSTLADGILMVPNPFYTAADRIEDQKATGRYYSIWAAEGPDGSGGTEPMIFAGRGFLARFDLDGSGSTYGLSAMPTWTPDKELFRLNATALSIESDANCSGAGGGTSFSPGTGFDLNSDSGRIFIGDTSPLGNEIKNLALTVANQDKKFLAFRLKYSAPVSSDSIASVEGLTRSSRSIAIEIQQQDTNRSGYRSLFSIFKTRLTPEGDFSLIQDATEFSTVELTGSLERPNWAQSGVADLNGFFNKREVKL